jgi:hypothetical protein
MDESQQMEAARQAATKGSKVHGIGLVPGHPRLCFRCRQPILEFDLWAKYTSPADPPGYAVYSILFHQRCDGAGTATNVTTLCA